MPDSGSWDPQQLPGGIRLPFEHLSKHWVSIGTGHYSPSDFLPFLEDLIVQIEGISVANIDFNTTPLSEAEQGLCLEMFGRIPGRAFLETKAWKLIKDILTTHKKLLSQKLCAELDYCKRKPNIPVTEILAAIGEVIKLIPFPPVPQVIGAALQTLAAVWFLFSFSIDKFCGCEK